MNRRQVLAGAIASTAAASFESQAAGAPNTCLELKSWQLHNSEEDQPARVRSFLEHGLAPALAKSGAQLAGAFENVIAPEGPFYITLVEYASLGAMREALTKLASDGAYLSEIEKLGSGPGLPFVRVESSLLRSFDVMPRVTIAEKGAQRARIFELRRYESQSFATLKRKVGMFNDAEARIFERLGMRPVFFGETIVGPRQPNLMYMLSYDDLAARDRLWREFGGDPEWQKLKARPELSDPQIVANISNMILRPLPFSPVR